MFSDTKIYFAFVDKQKIEFKTLITYSEMSLGNKYMFLFVIMFTMIFVAS